VLAGSFAPGPLRRLDDTPGMTAGMWEMRPLSRGYVEARSNRPSDPPAINPRYLSEDTDRGVEQPGIAGFGGEQHQLTGGCSATFLLLSTTASTASSYTVTSAACRGPSRTAAEYRAHERAFGVELACNRRTARERIGFGRGPLLDCGGQLHRAGLEGGGFGFQGLEPSG